MTDSLGSPDAGLVVTFRRFEPKGVTVADREDAWAAEMRAANRGDSAAYERLLGEIASVLRRMIRGRLSRLGLNPQEAEDIVQEVLIGIHQKRATWDETRPFLPWLHAIARYKLVDAARRLGRHRRLLADVEIDEIAGTVPAAPGNTDLPLRDVERLLARLPSRQRELVLARSVEGASMSAIADRFQMTEGAVRTAFHRGLRRLAKLAGEAEEAIRQRSR